MGYAMFLKEKVADTNICSWMHLHAKYPFYVLTNTCKLKLEMEEPLIY